MAITKLAWERRELTLPSTSPLRSAPLGLAPTAPPAPAEKLSYEFPILTSYKTPGEKIRILLEKAAEVEHALMIEYLYAAYSLKPTTGAGAATDPLEVADLNNWRMTILGIAKEEMGHLLTVQNLRLLFGIAPTFEREDFPIIDGLFPFKSSLRALDQQTLAAYIVAESPTDPTGIDDIIAVAKGTTDLDIDHVGVLYGLIGVLLATNLDEIKADAAAGDFWYKMVLQLAGDAYDQNSDPEAWHLQDDAFQADSAARQGVQGDWAPPHSPIRIDSPKNRQDAKKAIQFIGLQGEGPGESTTQPSHFQRFLQIYRGVPGKTRPFPDTKGWVPTLAVPTDPSSPGVIGNPTTLPWTTLANLRYAILLGLLEEYLSKDPVADRGFLHQRARYEMVANIARLSAVLVTLPRATTGSGVAALPFDLPKYGFPLPTNPADRRKVIAGRFDEAIALEKQIIKDQGDTHSILAFMQSQDETVVSHFR